MGDRIKEPTYRARTGKELERLNYAVSDEMIEQEHKFHSLLNQMEDEIMQEWFKDEQTRVKK